MPQAVLKRDLSKKHILLYTRVLQGAIKNLLRNSATRFTAYQKLTTYKSVL